MTSLGALFLAIGGVVAYFGLVTYYPFWRRVPWEMLAVSAAGGLLGLVAFGATPGFASGAAALAAVAVFGSFVWYIFGYSMLGPREARPRAGDPFPDFALADSTGATFRLSDARGRRLFLLFYRGDW